MQYFSFLFGQIARRDNMSGLVERDKPLIEQRIQVRYQQKPIIRVNPLVVRRLTPWFSVRRFQHRQKGASGDGAPFPQLNQMLSIIALPYAAFDNRVLFGFIEIFDLYRGFRYPSSGRLRVVDGYNSKNKFARFRLP